MSRAWIGGLAVSFALVGVAAASPDETTIEDRLRAQLLAERADTRAMRRAHAGALVTVRERHARQVAGLRRTMLARPNVQHALRLAATTYGVPYADLLSVAKCESNLNPTVMNRQGSGAGGLMQWMRPSWLAYAYGKAGFSRFDPYAAALQAARIVAREGWRQWECKP